MAKQRLKAVDTCPKCGRSTKSNECPVCKTERYCIHCEWCYNCTYYPGKFDKN